MSISTIVQKKIEQTRRLVAERASRKSNLGLEPILSDGDLARLMGDGDLNPLDSLAQYPGNLSSYTGPTGEEVVLEKLRGGYEVFSVGRQIL